MEKARKWQFVVMATLAMCLLAGCATTGYPQFPYSSWGEITGTAAGKDNPGIKLDAYAEVGADWAKLGSGPWSPVFNTFVGLRGTVSGRPSYWWDNKVGPWFGAKLKWTIPMPNNGWGEIALGIRGEFYTYFRPVAGMNYDNDLRCVGFLQWSFGGKLPIGAAASNQ